MNDVLARWNAADPHAAETEILPCNGSHLWAAQLVKERPFATEAALFAAADAAWASLDPEAQQEAFDSHPRLGERHAVSATQNSLQWSAGEQSALGAEDTAKAALAHANRVYEQRFARIFLVCATAKSTTEILEVLHKRLDNDHATERRETAEQQRRITQLRLRKWLGMPAVACEDV